MVLRRDGEVGEIAGPTDVLFWVGPPAPMQVVAEINEEEINRIASGQKAFLRSEAFPGRALRANVSQITPKGDPTRKTFRVYLRLPQDTPLRIGMSVEANIIFREKPSAIVVPAEAIAGDWVQMVDDGRVQRVPITVGIRGNRNIEIIGDVSKGTTVLSPARRDLADGARIRIDNSLTRAVEAAAISEPADQPVATPEAAVVSRGRHRCSHGSRRRGDFGSHDRPHRFRRQRRASQHHQQQPVTAVKLIFNIAWTHVSSRVRQTLVGHGRRVHGSRLHHHDGGPDAGFADRLPAPAGRHHAAHHRRG